MPVKALRFSALVDTPGQSLGARPVDAEAAEIAAAAAESPPVAESLPADTGVIAAESAHIAASAKSSVDLHDAALGAQVQAPLGASSFAAASASSVMAMEAPAAGAADDFELSAASADAAALSHGAASRDSASAGGGAAASAGSDVGETMQVYLRLRPLSEAERRGAGEQPIMSLESAQTVRVVAPEV